MEAIWTHENYMPTLEDYLDNAWRSVSGMVALTHGYFLIYQDFKNDAVESLEKKHDLYKWSSMLFRLYNDLAASLVCFRFHCIDNKFYYYFFFLISLHA